MGFLYALESVRTPFLNTVLGLITQLGGETVYLVAAIFIFWCVDKRMGYYVLTVGFTGTVVSQALKITFRIPRPWVLDGNFTIVESARAAATGYSFPSGHTTNVFASFGCIGRWTKRGWLRALCAAVIVLVAFSRMYLGVHTPLDVSVGALIGLVLMLALYPLFRDMDRRPDTMYWVLGAMLAAVLLYLCYVELWPFPADVDADNLTSARQSGYSLLGASSGMLLAYFLDRRYIRFDTRAPLWGQAVKLVVGLCLVLAIKTLLKAPFLALFGNASVATAARYFLVILFAAGVWPMTFRLFRVREK